MKNFFIITAIFLLPTSVSGEIYKWIDDHGITHFSDKPNKTAKKIKLNAANQIQSVPKETIDRLFEKEKQQLEKEETEERARYPTPEEKKQNRCRFSRNALLLAKKQGQEYVTSIDSSGNTYKKDIDRAIKEISENCGELLYLP